MNPEPNSIPIYLLNAAKTTVKEQVINTLIDSPTHKDADIRKASANAMIDLMLIRVHNTFEKYYPDYKLTYQQLVKII